MGLGTALCRTGLFAGGDSYTMAMELHHAIYDGWSRALILDAVEQAYLTGKSPQDLSAFQPFVKHVLAISRSETTADFWREQLGNYDASTFPAAQHTPGLKVDINHTVSKLEWPRNGITASSTIRTALAILLATYTDSKDIIFGATGSGRQVAIPNVEKIAGPTIATTPVRVVFDWDQTVNDLQLQVQRQMLEIADHEQFGLQRIQRIMDDGEFGAGQFRLLLVVQPPDEKQTASTANLLSQPHGVSRRTPSAISDESLGLFNPYAMMIVCIPEASGLTLEVNFDSAAIKPVELQRFVRQLERLIRRLCTEEITHSKLRDVEIATEQDRAEILQWNDRAFTQECVGDLILDWVDERAAAQPDAIAVEAWDGQLTFCQVARISKAFARRLRRERVGRGDVIPICLEKSAWMSVSMLAVMRAGGIALPTPIQTTAHRAKDITDALKPRLAVSLDSGKIASPFVGLVQTIDPPSLNDLVEEEDGGGDLPTLHPSDGALIIFTSGSTGAPKGILWSHETATSNVRAAMDMFTVSATTRIFQFAGYDFDVHSIETLSILAAGGCLCVPSEDDRVNRVGDAIDHARANWVQLTPSVADALNPLHLPTLGTIVFAGEKLKRSTASRWTQAVNTVHNWYGPAEAPCATHELVEHEDWEFGRIGRSTHGSIWLVDPKNHNVLAPVGALAEICIEGPIVSNGYIGGVESGSFIRPAWLPRRSEKTAGGRGFVYRTGDIAKYSEDGRIVIQGRKEQAFAKLRGQRCRTDDIEHEAQAFLLSAASGARAVAEIFTLADGDDDILVLFVSPADCAGASQEEAAAFVRNEMPVEALEAKLAETLPPYMVPRMYVPLAKIPTSNTGKADRKHLRRLGSNLKREQLAQMQPVRRELRKPITSTEKLLSQVWAEILGIDVEKIHANDNFLRLGGDSIGAMRLVALARTHGFQLTSAQIFESPELSQMAEIASSHSVSTTVIEAVLPFSLLKEGLRESEARAHAAKICDIEETQIVDMYPCTALQEGLLALTEKMSGSYVSQSVLGLQDGVETSQLRNAWEATVEKLAILRTRIIDVPRQGLVQVVMKTLPMRFGDSVTSYVDRDELEPMGLGTALCRAAIVGSNFILTIHHSLYDGIALKLILQEFEERYLGKAGIAITPFQNFIQLLTNLDTREAASFWQDQLSHAATPKFPPLPTPTYQPEANENIERSISVPWPRTGMTASTVIRSAWSILAARYTASSQVMFGAIVSGRQVDIPGIDLCVAPTVTTVPVAVSIDWNESVQGFQQRLQQQTVEMTPYEQFGLQNIRTAVGDAKSAFQTLLVVQPVSEGRSLQADSLLFKARSFASSLDTRGTDPFNTHALMVSCWLTPTGMKLALSYDSRVLDTRQTNLLADQFETVLQQLCAISNNTTRLSDIQVASRDDAELVWARNSTSALTFTTPAQEAILKTAVRWPDQVAVHAWDGKFSYQEVNELSAVVARGLVGIGITPGSVVLLAMEGSRWTPIVVIAILRAGGVILPQPKSAVVSDVRSILDSIFPALAIVSQTHREVLERFTHCYSVEQLMRQPADQGPPTDLPTPRMADQAVILTKSGPLGKLKQFHWSHRTLSANVSAYQRAVGLNESSRVCQYHSLDSYVGIVEMMATFHQGGQICISSDFDRIHRTSAMIQLLGCNIACLTPTVGRLLEPALLPNLSTVVFTGEHLPQSQVDRWVGKRRLINWYGHKACPTAVFIDLSRGPLDDRVSEKYMPGPQSLVWLLDHVNPDTLAARGTVGEIAVEGPSCAVVKDERDGVSSAQEYLENPIFLSRGQRPRIPGRKGHLYRTGDFARSDSSGQFFIMGDKESMVTIGGHAISADDVERSIREVFDQSEKIEPIVAIVNTVETGATMLVAFVYNRNVTGVESDQVYRVSASLEDQLESVLPPDAIPASLIPISDIPLTSKGRIDRSRLQEIYAAHRSLPGTSDVQQKSTNLTMKARHISEDISSNSRIVLSAHVSEDLDEEATQPFALLKDGQSVGQSRQHAASLCNVSEDEVQDIYPCTQLQEGLLALTMRQPGDYTGLDMLTLAATVDIARFRTAWERVVAATPILRTRIVDLPGQGLMQVVLRASSSSWSTARTVDQYLRQIKDFPVKLGSPLVRYGLFPGTLESGESYQFALTTHHSAYDGITNALLRESLERQYQDGTSTTLNPYQAFIKYIKEQDKDIEFDFWKGYFEGMEAPQFPALPYEGYQPKADTSTTHLVDIAWRKDHFTASTIIRGAWSLLCAKYTNSLDTVFGTIVSGRQAALEGIERVAGPTITALPVRIQLDYGQDIEAFLELVQSQSIEAIQFEQTGLSRIRKISEEARQACQFQSMLVVQPQKVDVADSSLFVSGDGPSKHKKGTSNHAGFNSYALMVLCTLGTNDLEVEFSFDSSIIECDVVTHMAEQFGEAVRQLCSLPLNAKLLDVNPLTAKDLRSLRHWNSKVPESNARCIHDWISQTAKAHPDSIAISAWDGELTYGRLEQLSTSLAHELIARGVKQGDVVPLCFEKSMWTPVAFLAVVKAGGAFLLLDVTQPVARLQIIIRQARPNIILSSLASRTLAFGLVENVVEVGHEVDTLADKASLRHESELPIVTPSSLLYIVFTSGSTGVPKGCMITHQNFATALLLQRKSVPIDHTTRMYEFSSYSFDAAHWTFLNVLTAGGTLCIPSEEERRSQLTESIRRFSTTDVDLTPAVSRMVDFMKIPTIRNVYLGGELVRKEDVASWMSAANAVIIYGPAECSATATISRIPNPPPEKLSIGTGAGLLTWIVDPFSNNRLTPVGTIGELWLEGPLVGSGYLGDPSKTAASFIETPSWIMTERSSHGDARSRMYKTGDLVKQNPADGSILFIGRKDSQVKLHGQRLELSEVDHHVRQALDDCGINVGSLASEVVVPQSTGRKALVVFVQLEQAQVGADNAWADRLQSMLDSQVPSYMVPSAYVTVDSIPLTTAGKIDRRNLQRMGVNLTIEQMTATAKSAVGKAPSTEPERHLQRLWSVFLGVPLGRIGTESNFFRMSGDSITAMQMASLARQQGVSLTVMNILKLPNFSEMVKTMGPLQAGSLGEQNLTTPFSLLSRPHEKESTLRLVAGQCKIAVSDIEDVFPCTGVQKSLLAFTTKRPGDYIARSSLQLKGDVDLERLKIAWESVAKSSAPILRNRIVHVPTEGLVQVQVGLPLQWNTYESVEDYLTYDERQSMALSEPLTRLAIVTGNAPDQKRCILTQHHAIYDGASFQLLLREVSKAYAGAVDDSPIAPFQSFLSHINRIDREKTKGYWAHEFAECEAVPFPVLPSPDYQPAANSTVRRDIDGLKWPSYGATPSTVIRAAWAILSARYTDSDDVVFGALVTGRQAPVLGIERMIAPLIAALPVRVKFDPAQTVEQLLAQMQDQAIDMIPYEHTDLLDIRKINNDTASGARFNALLIVQPPTPKGATDTSENIFSSHCSVGASTKGLDNFNPHAMMLMCMFRDVNDIQIEISFDSNAVSSEQMNLLAAQFEHVIRHICDHRKRSIADVELASPQDIERLWAWNAEVPAAVERCVHEMISSTVVQQPQAPAICSWDGSLTYQELEDITDRFASHLVKLGVGRGDIVPLCFEKSMWHPIAALSALKAGAAAVSMDATQPEGRLRSIVQQIQPRFILSSATNRQLASQLSGLNVTVIVADKPTIPDQAVYQLPGVSPSDTLYIVFTSGSTGTPKGIVATHENFATAAVHHAEMLLVKPGTRVFDFVSYSFDVAWSNLLNTFIQGGCLCIPSETERKNDIPRALNRMGADYVYFTPSVARSLDPTSMPGLRTLAMGGEPIQSAEIARWAQTDKVVGAFGPAECTQATCIVHLSSSSRNSHVGYAFGANAWLVKPGNPEQLAAIGTIGELIMEGPTVAQCYFNEPEKTATAFIDCPKWLSRGTTGHQGRTKGRIYKTGDLLRQNPDGSMDFIGRKDGLIKLRGQRIELSEVEYHVRANLRDPRLCDSLAAEIIKPQNSDQPILAIFFGLSTAQSPGQKIVKKLGRVLEGLEERLEQRLPQYMIPGAYIPLETIPMTTTNKTDRRALREIGSKQRLESLAELQAQGTKRQAPSTDMEKRLQELWSSVLGIEAASINADSSFLRIGGESISAMRLVAAARQQKLSLTVADIFKNPRLNQLARVVKEVKKAEGPMKARKPFSLLPTKDFESFFEEYVEPKVDADLDEVHDILPVTDFQQNAVDEALKDMPGRYPHWILDLPANVDMLKLKRACRKLVEHFEILRTVFVSVKGRYWQVVLKNFRAPFDIVEANDDDEDVVAFTNAVCKKDMRKERRPGRSFLGFIAIKHPSNQHKFVIRISHAQFDGFSFGSVLDTLAVFYRGETIAPAASFGDVIAFSEQKKREALDYWAKRMKGNGSTFPAWSKATSAKAEFDPQDRLIIEMSIPLPRSKQVEDISPATLFHAACIMVLAKEHDLTDAVMGRLVTGRSMLPSQLQSAVGPCLTEVPIRYNVKAGDSVASIANDLQGQFIEDSKYESAGMQEIVKESTGWGTAHDNFGWRTAFQQEEGEGFEFLGGPSKVSFYERDEPPRHRPEIYATPSGENLVLMFEGNRKVTSEEMARHVLERVKDVLATC